VEGKGHVNSTGPASVPKRSRNDQKQSPYRAPVQRRGSPLQSPTSLRVTWPDRFQFPPTDFLRLAATSRDCPCSPARQCYHPRVNERSSLARPSRYRLPAPQFRSSERADGRTDGRTRRATARLMIPSRIPRKRRPDIRAFPARKIKPADAQASHRVGLASSRERSPTCNFKIANSRACPPLLSAANCQSA